MKVQVVRRGRGKVQRESDSIRRRARCSDRDCEGGSWTVYAVAAYPHRVFQLAVTVSAVTQVIFGSAVSLAAVATRHACSRRSLARWIAWIAGLADPGHLARACARLDPDGIARSVLASVDTIRKRAGAVLRLFDRLVAILRDRGVRLPGRGPGLIRMLRHQWVRFRDVRLLTKSAPPLRVDLRALRL